MGMGMPQTRFDSGRFAARNDSLKICFKQIQASKTCTRRLFVFVQHDFRLHDASRVLSSVNRFLSICVVSRSGFSFDLMECDVSHVQKFRFMCSGHRLYPQPPPFKLSANIEPGNPNAREIFMGNKNSWNFSAQQWAVSCSRWQVPIIFWFISR